MLLFSLSLSPYPLIFIFFTLLGMGWAAAPPPPPAAAGAASKSGLGGDINPSILLIIVILSVIFFISGLLHLLVRFLLKPATRNAEELESATALQGQLQQLFHLHDAGVDQSFIDTLPVFVYRAIVGAKDPFDCAVCLCEFEADDKLRLLPKCSHAFHLECIDTWLLSHSTCPLCRSSLLPDLSGGCGTGGGAVLVLESVGESSREVTGDRDAGGEEEAVTCTEDAAQKGEAEAAEAELKVVSVKLGKFRNVDGGGGAAAAGGGEGSSALDERRCVSMGSFEYVMDETSRLQVAIKPPARNPAAKNPGHRLAMSECDWSSRREGFKGFEQLTRSGGGGGAIASNSQRAESFSISKIWLRWPRKDRPQGGEGQRRAISFRLSPPHPPAAAEEQKANCGSSRRSSDATCWEKNGSELGFDVEAGSCDGGAALSRAGETPSFARRTLLWLVGRHHKVVNHV